MNYKGSLVCNLHDGSNSEHLPVLNAVCGDDPKQNAGTIHVSNQEDLPVFKTPCGEDPEKNAGTIHVSNLEHLLVFKGLKKC